MIADLKRFGAPDAVIQKSLAEQGKAIEEEHCYVWQENWGAVMLFTELFSQWNLLIKPSGALEGDGGVIYQGLNYPAVQSYMQMTAQPIKSRPALMRKLQEMEIAALPLLNREG